MRYVLMCLACLLAASLLGCGGGSGSLSGVRIKGVITMNGRPAVDQLNVTVYEQGYVGQADHLVANATVWSNAVNFRVPNPGVYDLRLYYPFAGGSVTQDVPNVTISAPETDLGTIDFSLPNAMVAPAVSTA